EEVRVKGWVRRVSLTPRGDTELYTPRADESVGYVVKDSRDNEITKGTARLGALAGFELSLKLPPTTHLGGARVEFDLAGSDYTHGFQVQEFRRPEFEVTARASGAPHFVGASATAAVEASYYAGGRLPGAEVAWTVTARAARYTPPGRDDYTFGVWTPWWGDPEDSSETKERELKSRTDAEGRHALRIDFDSVEPARPTSVTAVAQVSDVNRQTLSAETTMLVHPADVYVGLKTARTFVGESEPFDVRLVVTDLDGRALAGRDVWLRLARLDYVREDGEWVQKEADAREQVVRSGDGEVGATLATKGGGVYRLKARVRDAKGRANESELTLWVAGGKVPPSRGVEQEKAELIPDRGEYHAGDVAEILVRAPFAPAEGLLTLRRSGVVRTERFRMAGASYVLRVPLEEALTPNVHLQVDLVGAAARVDDEGRERASLPKRPAYASGEINVKVPPASRRLSVKATPRDGVLEPGGETFVDVEVRDAQGRAAAGTETAVVVVDESVLALTDYKLEDPLSIFYAERESETDDYHLREHVEIASAEELERVTRVVLGDRNVGGGGPGGGGGGGVVDYMRSLRVSQLSTFQASVGMPYPSGSPVTRSNEVPAEPGLILRRNFNALSVFAASLPTDASGRARVKVKLPDNLTRYRVMAVSVAGGRLAGAGESSITARLPLMARPSAPRFLNFGDRAELPVVLQNQTERDADVSVAVRATNAVLTAGAGRRLRVPAGERVEVRFPVAAARPGTARFQIAAAASEPGGGADAAEVSLPVYTPATTEAFATYGVIDEGAAVQPVKTPAGAFKEFGGLEVQTSSTQLQELTDAFIYVYRYPYGCGEQIASRVLSVVALADVLAAFGTKDLPPPSALRASIGADLERLRGLQNPDGGFGFWRRAESSVPFVSAHVAHALARAKGKGFDVPDEMLSSALFYLREVRTKIPKEYSAGSRRAIESYALYVRALLGERDAAGARRVIAEAGGVEQLSLESLGWLLPVLSGDAASVSQAEAVRRHFANRVTETAGAAHFADSYSDGAYAILHSDRRADGVVLEALIIDRPESDLIPKLVRGLLAHRKRGRWSNTQENVFILLALERYFRTYEKATPDFVARVWLGRDFAGEHAFTGRSAERASLELPMSELATRNAAADGAAVPLTIGKEGAGRLYFRVGATYAPSNLNVEAADYGFRVERMYEFVDDPGDVRRDAEGLWHLKAGARVRVRVRMFAPARRYHVALVDPLPAGLEALNPELATTGPLPDVSIEEGILRHGGGVTDYYRYWRGTWYEHQNLRDERAEVFASLLWEGEHEFVYFARATTPGLFVVPPPKAEEMYAPETFGRGKTDRVLVE
ncbi:MAG: alpha-2-macroglobulin family protein, partial [Pyrinomonadaceae bacterium]